MSNKSNIKSGRKEILCDFRDRITDDKDIAISVLMSVYNPDDVNHLHDAVKSVIEQTFTDWELIICDDASDVCHSHMIRRIADIDERIRFIKNDVNIGLAGCMNRALRYSRGRYIARMDADDTCHPDRFRLQFEFLEKHPQYSWTGSNTSLFDEKGRWGSREVPEVPGNKDFLSYSPYIHPSVMFRRSVLIQNRGYRISRRGEDYELFMRLHSLGHKGYNIQKELFNYREDSRNYARRSFFHHMEETGIRYKGFKRLGMLNLKTAPYVVKPLVKGLLPHDVQFKLKQRMRKETHVERLNR